MKLIDLKGKTALLTGGSRGVGRATCQMLAAAGAKVGFCYRSREKEAEETLSLIQAEGGNGWAQKADLSEESGVLELFSRFDKEFTDGIDIFIANAGVWFAEEVSIDKLTNEQWRQTLSLNLDSVYWATREAVPRLRNGGRIVYVSSTAAQRGEAMHVDYAASKGALHSMVKGLCVEMGPRSITVNCVAPGWIDTEMAAPVYAVAGERERIEQNIPLKRMAGAEDVAGPIVFLCSDLARHITGEVLNINGGSVLCG